MEPIRVESSNIETVQWCGDIKSNFGEGDLIVEYKSGARYSYKKVPQSTFTMLMESDSKGRFVNSEIKGKFEYERV